MTPRYGPGNYGANDKRQRYPRWEFRVIRATRIGIDEKSTYSCRDFLPEKLFNDCELICHYFLGPRSAPAFRTDRPVNYRLPHKRESNA